MTIQLTRNKSVGRNELCPCKSGLKFKICHGDRVKQMLCNQAANERMVELIIREKIKKGLICKHGVPAGEKCIDCMGPQEINLNKGEN